MDPKQTTPVEPAPSRFKTIITSRPATLIGAAVAGAISVCVVAALNTRAKVEGAMLVLEAQEQDTPEV